MARKLTVYTGKGVGVFDLSARPDMYTEPQAATIVMHDQEAHERVYTESEVRAMFAALRQNEFFSDCGTMLMCIEDFDDRVASLLSDPA